MKKTIMVLLLLILATSVAIPMITEFPNTPPVVVVGLVAGAVLIYMGGFWVVLTSGVNTYYTDKPPFVDSFSSDQDIYARTHTLNEKTHRVSNSLFYYG